MSATPTRPIPAVSAIHRMTPSAPVPGATPLGAALRLMALQATCLGTARRRDGRLRGLRLAFVAGAERAGTHGGRVWQGRFQAAYLIQPAERADSRLAWV